MGKVTQVFFINSSSNALPNLQQLPAHKYVLNSMLIIEPLLLPIPGVFLLEYIPVHNMHILKYILKI